MAEESGVFVGTPLASDTAHARLVRRHAPDGVVASGPDAGSQLTLTATASSQLTLGTGYALSGGWFYRTDAPVPITVPPNPASQPRRDLVVIRADTALGACYPHIITGTPGSSTWPAPVRVPAGTWDTVLGRYTIAGGSAVVAPRDLDLSVRQWTAPSGAIPCVSTARPVSPWPGCLAQEIDTGRLILFVDGVWRTVYDAGFPTPWQDIELRPGYRTPTHGNSPTWRFKESGLVELRGTIERSNGAALPSGEYYARVPSAARRSAWWRQPVACESRGGTAVMRIDVVSTSAGAAEAGRLVGYSSHSPRWLALDGISYYL
jgi:hypothetical protein